MNISLQKAKTLDDIGLRRLKQLTKKHNNVRPWLDKIVKAEKLKKLTAEILGEISKIKYGFRNALQNGKQTEMEFFATSMQQYIESGGAVWYFERVDGGVNKWLGYLNEMGSDLKLAKLKPLSNAYGGGDNYYLTCYKGENIITTLLILTQTQLAILKHNKTVMQALMKTK